MLAKCILCPITIKSLLIDSKEAISEVSNQFLQHLSKQHPKELVQLQGDLQALIQLCTWYLASQMMEVVERKKEFDEVFQKQEDLILQLLNLVGDDEEKVDLVKD